MVKSIVYLLLNGNQLAFPRVQLGYFNRYTDIIKPQLQIVTQGSYPSEWCFWPQISRWVWSLHSRNAAYLFHAKHHIARIPHEGHHKLLDPGKFPEKTNPLRKKTENPPGSVSRLPFSTGWLGQKKRWKARHRMHTSNIIITTYYNYTYKVSMFHTPQKPLQHTCIPLQTQQFIIILVI